VQTPSTSPRLRRIAVAVLALAGVTALAIVARNRLGRARVVDAAPAHAPVHDIDVFDVGARARTMAAEYAPGQPHKDMYYEGTGGTAHLHLILPGQTIPLHIHEHSEEATVPVMGRPVVTQRFASGSGIETKKGRYDEGTIVVSPHDCAHEWANPLADQFHASLVFTLGDAFRRNLFVKPDDPRIATSSPAVVLDPTTQFDEFVASDQRLRRVDLPIAQGSLAAIFAKDSFPVEPGATDVALVYVARGVGRIEGPSTPIALTPSVLVVLRHAAGARVVADAGAAVVFYLVRIPLKPGRPVE
jgi:hypothetical protein